MSVKPRPWDFLLGEEQRQALAALMIVEDSVRREWGGGIVDLSADGEDHGSNLDYCFKKLEGIIRKDRSLVERGIKNARQVDRYSAEGSPLFFVYTLIAEKSDYFVLPLSDGINSFTEYAFPNKVLSRLHLKAVVELLKMLKPESPDYVSYKEDLKRLHKLDFEKLGWTK